MDSQDITAVESPITEPVDTPAENLVDFSDPELNTKLAANIDAFDAYMADTWPEAESEISETPETAEVAEGTEIITIEDLEPQKQTRVWTTPPYGFGYSHKIRFSLDEDDQMTASFRKKGQYITLTASADEFQEALMELHRSQTSGLQTETRGILMAEAGNAIRLTLFEIEKGAPKSASVHFMSTQSSAQVLELLFNRED